MHLCSALLKFTTYPCYHVSIFHLSSDTIFYSIQTYIQLSIYSNFQFTTRLVFPSRIKNGQIGISSVMYCISSVTTKKVPIISTSHLFSPFQTYSFFKIFVIFPSRTLSDIALMTWDDASSTGAGCRTREGSSQDISQIYYKCIYACMQNCLCHLATASLCLVWCPRICTVWAELFVLVLGKVPVRPGGGWSWRLIDGDGKWGFSTYWWSVSSLGQNLMLLEFISRKRIQWKRHEFAISKENPMLEW